MSESEPDTEKQTYRLTDGIDRVVRSGLVLDGDEEIEAYPDIERDHGDVLERVDAAGEADEDADPDEPEQDDEGGDDE